MERKSISNGIVNYTFNKLFLPKKIIINQPGIIINQLSRKYGGIKSRQRIIYYFEDIIADIYLATNRAIGQNKTKEMWYKIGRDVGTRYMILSNAKKIPSTILPIILNYVFKGFKSGGFSIANNISYDPKKQILTMNGQDNIFCRKTKNGDTFAGIAGAVASSLCGSYMEGEMMCKDCPNKCKMIIKKKKIAKYKPNLEELSPIREYDKLNFTINPKISRNDNSFKDLIYFKKIVLDNFNKFCYRGETVAPAEFGFIGLITDRYKKEGLLDIFEKSINKSSKKLAKKLLDGNLSTKNKIALLSGIISSFGCGVLRITQEKDEIFASFTSVPVTKYDYDYLIFFIKGFLEHILKKSLNVTTSKSNPYASSLIINYKLD